MLVLLEWILADLHSPMTLPPTMRLGSELLRRCGVLQIDLVDPIRRHSWRWILDLGLHRLEFAGAWVCSAFVCVAFTRGSRYV